MFMMRVAATLLVLLFSMYGAQTQTEVQTESQNQTVSTELKELRDMVVGLSVALRFTQDELQNTKVQLTLVTDRLVTSEAQLGSLTRLTAKQEEELKALSQRLAVAETDIEHVKRDTTAADTGLTIIGISMMELVKENAAQDAQLTVLKTRLNTTETEVEDLKQDNGVQWADLSAVKDKMADTATDVENLKHENGVQEGRLTVLSDRLAATDAEIENLRREMSDTPKVAFSVGLLEYDGQIEAGTSDMYLVYSKILTNIGQAYNKITGFFTAPVRGVYYFRFTGMDFGDGRWMGILMYKNEEKVMYLSEVDGDGQQTYLSGGVTLQLETGDKVHMRLRKGSRLYDDVNNHSTFSGFLLFPL